MYVNVGLHVDTSQARIKLFEKGVRICLQVRRQPRKSRNSWTSWWVGAGGLRHSFSFKKIQFNFPDTGQGYLHTSPTVAYLRGGADCPPPLTSDKQKKREREREGEEGERREKKGDFLFCLSARNLSKIRCGNNVARHKVCAVKITAILLEMHWLHIRNLYWRGVQTSA